MPWDYYTLGDLVLGSGYIMVMCIFSHRISSSRGVPDCQVRPSWRAGGTGYGPRSVIFWVSGHPRPDNQRRGWAVGPGIPYIGNSDDYPPSLIPHRLSCNATTTSHSGTSFQLPITHKPAWHGHPILVGALSSYRVRNIDTLMLRWIVECT